MSDTPFIGPSYALTSRPASVQRTVNLMPIPLEPGNERAGWIFKDVPGLVRVETIPVIDPFNDDIILLARFVDNTAVDDSPYNAPYAFGGVGAVNGNAFAPGPLFSQTGTVTWTGTHLYRPNDAATTTIECWFDWQTLLGSDGLQLVRWNFGGLPAYSLTIAVILDGPGASVSMFDTTSVFTGYKVAGGPNTLLNVTAVIPTGPSPMGRFYVNGTLVDTRGYGMISLSNGEFQIGQSSLHAATTQYRIRSLRVTAAERYTGSSFTVPSLPLPDFIAP